MDFFTRGKIALVLDLAKVCPSVCIEGYSNQVLIKRIRVSLPIENLIILTSGILFSSSQSENAVDLRSTRFD